MDIMVMVMTNIIICGDERFDGNNMYVGIITSYQCLAITQNGAPLLGNGAPT
jgi:hypothetical protein